MALRAAVGSLAVVTAPTQQLRCGDSPAWLQRERFDLEKLAVLSGFGLNSSSASSSAGTLCSKTASLLLHSDDDVRPVAVYGVEVRLVRCAVFVAIPVHAVAMPSLARRLHRFGYSGNRVEGYDGHAVA